jgi:hypothetical protein
VADREDGGPPIGGSEETGTRPLQLAPRDRRTVRPGWPARGVGAAGFPFTRHPTTEPCADRVGVEWRAASTAAFIGAAAISVTATAAIGWRRSACGRRTSVRWAWRTGARATAITATATLGGAGILASAASAASAGATAAATGHGSATGRSGGHRRGDRR